MKFDWISDIVNSVLQWIFNAVVDFIMPFLEVTCSLNTEIWEIALIEDGLRYSQILATSILTAKVLYELFMTYVVRKGEDPAGDPMHKVMSAAFATFVIWIIPELVEFMANFGNSIVRDIGIINSDTFDKFDNIRSNSLIQDAISTAWNGIIDTGGIMGILFSLVMIIVLLVAYCIISFQLIKRSVELMLFALIGPFFALSLTKDDFGPMKEWGKKLILLCTSHAVQIFLFRLSLQMLFGGANGYNQYFAGTLSSLALYLFIMAVAIFAINVQGFIGKLLDAASPTGSFTQKAFTAAQISRMMKRN